MANAQQTYLNMLDQIAQRKMNDYCAAALKINVAARRGQSAPGLLPRTDGGDPHWSDDCRYAHTLLQEADAAQAFADDEHKRLRNGKVGLLDQTIDAIAQAVGEPELKPKRGRKPRRAEPSSGTLV